MATTALTEAEVTEKLAAAPGWTREGGAITRTFKFDSYLAGIAFASAVGVVCEGLNHHPDLFIGWRKVTVTFTTHDAGSQLSAHDFRAAAAVDALGYPKA